jgi:hypothetical protein
MEELGLVEGLLETELDVELEAEILLLGEGLGLELGEAD